MTKLIKRISESKQVFEQIKDILTYRQFDLDDRKIVAVGSLSSSIEYHSSLYLLCHYKQYGSAASLLRSQIEAHVKGIWFLHCCLDTKIEKAYNDELNIGINKLIRDLEQNQISGWEDIKEIKLNYWKILCGYTHSAKPQIARRFKDGNITPNYDDGFIISILNLGDFIAFRSLLELIKVSKGVVSNRTLNKLCNTTAILRDAFFNPAFNKQN